MPEERKKILLLSRRAPYSGLLARAALDAALAASVFDQDLTLLFMDDGVWQLLPGQDGAIIDRKSITATLDSMPLYDIEDFYVEAESIEKRGLAREDLRGNTRFLEKGDLPRFMEGFQQVWSF